jgi:adenylate cyclase
LARVYLYRRDYDRALAQIDRALALNPSASENFEERGFILLWSGKPADAVPWLEAALQLDIGSSRASMHLGMAKYFLRQYAEAVTAFDRALARDAGRVIQLYTRPVLAASYARLEQQQDVERERALVTRLSPFFNAERFAAQFGTQEARDDMLTGLKAAGFP